MATTSHGGAWALASFVPDRVSLDLQHRERACESDHAGVPVATPFAPIASQRREALERLYRGAQACLLHGIELGSRRRELCLEPCGLSVERGALGTLCFKDLPRQTNMRVSNVFQGVVRAKRATACVRYGSDEDGLAPLTPDVHCQQIARS